MKSKDHTTGLTV